jgi:tRNA (guanine37-N1)-methyltransferase
MNDESDAKEERLGMSRQAPWQATVLTLFPEMFPGLLGASLPGKGLKEGLWRLETLDIRSFARDKHASVDDTPYGGGAGMVMRPDVVDEAIGGAEAKFGPASRKIYLSPRGRVLDQALVKELAGEQSLLLLCGRYEGVDQRVIDAQELEEVSLGDFVLAGGEVAAMALIEACVRLLPGILGNAATVDEESFEAGLLEYPHYTRPAAWKGMRVPDVLVSGHHEKVRAWRHAQAEKMTQERRPDLYKDYVLGHKASIKRSET